MQSETTSYEPKCNFGAYRLFFFIAPSKGTGLRLHREAGGAAPLAS